jgi:hypothetical protein
MIRIAVILKSMVRIAGHGWALRFKSNETGLIFNNCGARQAKKIAETLAKDISLMEPVHLGLPETPDFHFSATISWCIWPIDGPDWENLFNGNYAYLLENWKAGGERIIHYSNELKE